MSYFMLLFSVLLQFIFFTILTSWLLNKFKLHSRSLYWPTQIIITFISICSYFLFLPLSLSLSLTLFATSSPTMKIKSSIHCNLSKVCCEFINAANKHLIISIAPIGIRREGAATLQKNYSIKIASSYRINTHFAYVFSTWWRALYLSFEWG